MDHLKKDGLMCSGSFSGQQVVRSKLGLTCAGCSLCLGGCPALICADEMCWEHAAMFGCRAGDRSSEPLQLSHLLVHLVSELCMFYETNQLYCASLVFLQHRRSECQL